MLSPLPQVDIGSTKGSCLDKRVSGGEEVGGCRDRSPESGEGGIAQPWELQDSQF